MISEIRECHRWDTQKCPLCWVGGFKQLKRRGSKMGGCGVWVWTEDGREVRGRLTCPSALKTPCSVRRTWFKSKLWGKQSEWQIFSVCKFLVANLMRWMVKVWGKWVSFKTWRSKSLWGWNSKALKGADQRNTRADVCSSPREELDWEDRAQGPHVPAPLSSPEALGQAHSLL